MATKVGHGARSRLVVNDTEIGYVEGANWNVGRIVAGVEEMGEALPTEGVPVAVGPGSLSANLIATIDNKKTLFDLGFIPAMDTDSILNFGPYEITLKDVMTGKTFLKCTGCTVTNEGGSVQARGIMRENVAWWCRTVERIL